MNEDEIRLDERKKCARELLELHDHVQRVAMRAGIWIAAIHLDPSLNPSGDEKDK